MFAAPPAEHGDDEEEEDEEDGTEDGLGREELWEEEGVWLTSFPPPTGFDGAEDGVPGTEDYRRTLSEAEEEALAAPNAEEERDRAEAARRACARRDRFFGFEGGLDPLDDGEAPEDEEISSPMEAGLSRPSEPPAPPVEAVVLYEPAWLRARRTDGGQEQAGRRARNESVRLRPRRGLWSAP